MLYNNYISTGGCFLVNKGFERRKDRRRGITFWHKFVAYGTFLIFTLFGAEATLFTIWLLINTPM